MLVDVVLNVVVLVLIDVHVVLKLVELVEVKVVLKVDVLIDEVLELVEEVLELVLSDVVDKLAGPKVVEALELVVASDPHEQKVSPIELTLAAIAEIRIKAVIKREMWFLQFDSTALTALIALLNETDVDLIELIAVQ